MVMSKRENEEASYLYKKHRKDVNGRHIERFEAILKEELSEVKKAGAATCRRTNLWMPH